MVTNFKDSVIAYFFAFKVIVTNLCNFNLYWRIHFNGLHTILKLVQDCPQASSFLSSQVGVQSDSNNFPPISAITV